MNIILLISYFSEKALCSRFKECLVWLVVSGCLFGPTMGGSHLVAGIAGGEPSWRKAVVVSVHPLATEAGLNALKKGGNAVDAAVATGLTLGIVDGFNSGIGGGCLMLLRVPDGRVLALDGRETAPAAARETMFIRQGKADAELSQNGPLSIGIPGSLALYDRVIRAYGRLTLNELLLEASQVASEGFLIDAGYYERQKEVVDELVRFSESQRVFLQGGREALPVGTLFKQTDLAETYRKLARYGVNWFYKGPFAVRACRHLSTAGGIISVEDFSDYRVIEREVVRSFWSDFEILGFPPPSSGGTHVAQILNIMACLPIATRDQPSDSVWVHGVVEAMKAAFADRAFWLGDSDFADVPKGLMGSSYASALATRINQSDIVQWSDHGEPPLARTDLFSRHTTHFSAADADGWWVSCTATVNTSYGSKITIPGTGVVMNNQMDDFSAQPGAPNFFGLPGSRANSIQPKKRPLSSMSPTLVLKNGRPVLAIGAAGGPTIISQVVLGLLRYFAGERDVGEIVSAFRFHHQWKPDTLFIEKAATAQVIEELEKFGYEVKVRDSIGVCQVLLRNPVNGLFSAKADPRVNGAANGLP